MLRTRDNSDVFNTLDEVFGIHNKILNVLYLFINILLYNHVNSFTFFLSNEMPNAYRNVST